MLALLVGCAVDPDSDLQRGDTAGVVPCGGAAHTSGVLALVGDAPGDRAGFAVAGAKDMDGDGCDDVLIAALAYDDDSSARVVASLSFGGPDLRAGGVGGAPVIFDQGESGGSVGVGDVDRDGFADLLLACEDGQTREACLVPGREQPGAGDLASPQARYTGDWAYGLDLAGAGDVNGDGYADLLLGEVADAATEGAVHVVLGEPSPDHAAVDVAASLTVRRTAEGDTGGAIGLGDVDADGFDEIAFGADGIGMIMGAAQLAGERTSEDFDEMIACGRLPTGPAGDVDGDGFDDILATSSSEAAYVFRGGVGRADRTCEDAVIVYAGDPAAQEIVGATATGAGDVDSDGRDDVLVGTVNGGAAYLFLGRTRSGIVGVADADVRYDTAGGLGSGTPLAAAGDVDADGFDDFLIGAPRYDSERGVAFLVFGPPS